MADVIPIESARRRRAWRQLALVLAIAAAAWLVVHLATNPTTEVKA